uniref:Uncharacterized protein n=1 Tax=Oryza brachyantha TaxID=4533 RepID=J3N1F8_ORYBR
MAESLDKLLSESELNISASSGAGGQYRVTSVVGGRTGLPDNSTAIIRFWALGENLESSDDEDEPTEPETDVECSEGRDSDVVFLERAMAEGFTGDEHQKKIPRSCSKNKGARKNGEQARRIVDAVASKNNSRCKPWRGPLPGARRSQCLTIGDKLAEAMRLKKQKPKATPCSDKKEIDREIVIEREPGGKKKGEEQVILGVRTQNLKRGFAEGIKEATLQDRKPLTLATGRVVVTTKKVEQTGGEEKERHRDPQRLRSAAEGMSHRGGGAWAHHGGGAWGRNEAVRWEQRKISYVSSPESASGKETGEEQDRLSVLGHGGQETEQEGVASLEELDNRGEVMVLGVEINKWAGMCSSVDGTTRFQWRRISIGLLVSL